jgi:hypothetical protein
LNAAEELVTGRIGEKKRKLLDCLSCGTYALLIEWYSARLGYCKNCKLTYLYEYTPTAYVCQKCRSNLEFVKCCVVSARCNYCDIWVDFVCKIDDWWTIWNLVHDIDTGKAVPGKNFLLSIGEPIVVKPEAVAVPAVADRKYKSPTAVKTDRGDSMSATGKKFNMPEAAKQKLREAMKKRWQDQEYRRKVVEGLRRTLAAKKSTVGSSGAST